MTADPKARLYDQMNAVAEANGFRSLTQAVAEAVTARATRPANDRYVDAVWTCSCGSQLYNLASIGAVCFVCSKPAREWANS